MIILVNDILNVSQESYTMNLFPCKRIDPHLFNAQTTITIGINAIRVKTFGRTELYLSTYYFMFRNLWKCNVMFLSKTCPLKKLEFSAYVSDQYQPRFHRN